MTLRERLEQEIREETGDQGLARVLAFKLTMVVVGELERRQSDEERARLTEKSMTMQGAHTIRIGLLKEIRTDFARSPSHD